MFICQDEHLSAATESMFEVLILIISLLANRLNLSSANRSKPPSSDPNREKKPKPESGRKKGGQKGHIGTTQQKVENPDTFEPIKFDCSTIPIGGYQSAGYEACQVFDIDFPGW